LEKEREPKAKQISVRLERILLKEKVDFVLAKGQAPTEDKWNNTELKVMIQWYKRDGDKAVPKNKDGLLLRYRETHTSVVNNTPTYPHEDVESAVALAAAATTVVTTHPHPRLSATTTRPALPGPARSGTTRSSTTQSSALALKWLALAADGNPAASHADHAPATKISVTNTNTNANATTTDTTAIVTRAMASPAAVGRNLKQSPALAPQLNWGIYDAPFDVGIHLDLDAPARPLCNVDCYDDDDSSSDDDSSFVDLLRDWQDGIDLCWVWK
jgi:hypothetical protein